MVSLEKPLPNRLTYNLAMATDFRIPQQLEFKAPDLHEPLTGPYRNMYGSDFIAARYCGFQAAPVRPLGLWQHGWISDKDTLLEPDQIFGVKISHLPSEWYWVSTKLVENYLRMHGFGNGRAIGLPICYVPESNIERRTGTLLVMPAHSLNTTQHDWRARAYVEAITLIRNQFREIVVCVNAHCWTNGYWVPDFQAAGFKVIAGAHGDDPLTWVRMANLFREFEFVTTNAFGSLLAYASCFGAKVSIYGPYVEYTAKALSTAHFYLDFPRLADLAAMETCEETVRKRYPGLFCHPAAAADRTSWGRDQVGYDNKVSAEEMRKLFGWTALGRTRSRLSTYVGRSKAVIPEPIKWRLKAIASPRFRAEHQERRRLELTPRYRPGRTQLFGRTLEFVDASTFLEMQHDLFTRQIYRFIANIDKPLIIDGGANIGLSVLYFKCLYPNSKIIAFEADPAIFEVLERNCRTYKLAGVELIPKALWKCETLAPFQQEGSLAGRISPAANILVPTCRLSDYLHQPVNLLKLDIEGAETEVLLDCAHLLNNVANIFVEHHSFLNNQQDLHVAINLLHEAGFRVFVEPAQPAKQPLYVRTIVCGMDVQVNIFGFRV